MSLGDAQVMCLDSHKDSHKARTHPPRWRRAPTSSDEKGLSSYNPKATSAPPRAGTTGTVYI